MSEWSHLANAKHIDRIIAHARANPKAWDEVTHEVTFAAVRKAFNAAAMAAAAAARNAAWSAAWDAAYEAWEAAYEAAARDAAFNAASKAAWGAILALVVWDRASGLMDLPAEQVKVLALLGDQAAILMYPAIVAMETTQELV